MSFNQQDNFIQIDSPLYFTVDDSTATPSIKVVSDYTVYFEKTDPGFAAIRDTIQSRPDGSDPSQRAAHSINKEAIIKVSRPKMACELAGRLHACYCDGQTRICVTVRLDKESESKAKRAISDWLEDEQNQYDQSFKYCESWKGLSDSQMVDLDVGIAARLNASAFTGSAETSPNQPVSISAIAKQLHKQIFLKDSEIDSPPEQENLHGAILIAGRTKSAKSLITRALIHRFLCHQSTYRALVEQHSRRPHLITCEDPIETRFDKTTSSDKTSAIRGLIDYTARDKTSGDYRDLTETFRDALRQTPACLFVGELREKKDLEAIVEFAGTGHLVVATLHAGSLTDVFTKVFEANGVETPAKRGLVGQRVLAVIHLAQITVTRENGDRIQAVVPSLWRRSPASTAALVSAGVGSLTPQYAGENSSRYDCLGRQYFSNHLLNNIVDEQLRDEFVSVSRDHDLRGD